METAASFEARKAPSSYPTILGEAMETSASFEARSAPLPYPTTRKEQRFLAQSVLPKRLAPSHNDHRDPALGRLEFTYQRTWKEFLCRLSNPVVKKSAELLSLS